MARNTLPPPAKKNTGWLPPAMGGYQPERLYAEAKRRREDEVLLDLRALPWQEPECHESPLSRWLRVRGAVGYAVGAAFVIWLFWAIVTLNFAGIYDRIFHELK